MPASFITPETSRRSSTGRNKAGAATSVAILADRKGYYAQLEAAQKMTAAAAPLDLTPWMRWFLRTLLREMGSVPGKDVGQPLRPLRYPDMFGCRTFPFQAAGDIATGNEG